jgi:hypothetical protein
MINEDSADRRVKFYGLDDYGTYFQVEHAGKILEHYDPSSTSHSISDILELYNAQLFAENNLFPSSYLDSQREACRALIPELRKTVAKFFNAITCANVASAVVDVSYQYHDDLLQLFSKYKVYDRCDAAIMLPVLETTNIGIGRMLTSQRLVQSYEHELRARLVADPRHAEHLVQKYLEEYARHPTYLPASLTSADERTILEIYLDGDNVNSNFVELIATARVIRGGAIDAKLKLKAKRKYDALTKDLFENSTTSESSCRVSISDNQTEPVVEEFDGRNARYSYSQRWLEDTLDFPTILNNFIYLFEFTNDHMLLALPAYQAELGIFERFLKIVGRDSYRIGTAFQFKEQRSFLQTVLYGRFLQSRNIELESVIAWFFAEYLKEKFGATKLKFVPSSRTSSYLERSRHLFSEMESVINQFALYVENGELDIELLAMTSEQVRYKIIPSLLAEKYVYASGNQDILSILYLLFSDQSGLTYINANLQSDHAARLLFKNHVAYDDFADHQKRSVDYLISLGALENTGERVQFADINQFLILKAIFDTEATSYYHYSAEARTRIDDMVTKGWLVRRKSLLTNPEGSYFNYYLNQAEFSNGPELRNKYLHGSLAAAEDEEQHFRTYITVLKLLIALVIKINDDFCLRDNEENKGRTAGR